MQKTGEGRTARIEFEWLLPIAVLVVVGLLPGCGGGKSSPKPTPTPTPTPTPLPSGSPFPTPTPTPVPTATPTPTPSPTPTASPTPIPTPTPTPFVYRKDFEGGGSAGPEWSSQGTDVTPVGGRRFLGQFTENQTVTLNLNGLPAHNSVTISFDLYLIRSWDGDGSQGDGPDEWRLSVVGGATLLRTTFSNYNGTNGIFVPQHYPNSFPGALLHAGRTGAVEGDTLGYTNGANQDAVYHLSFTFNHTQSNVSFLFAGQGLQGILDESWGLDNVEVKTNP